MAAVASVVIRSDESSLPPSETGSDSKHAKLAMADMRAWEK